MDELNTASAVDNSGDSINDPSQSISTSSPLESEIDMIIREFQQNVSLQVGLSDSLTCMRNRKYGVCVHSDRMC